MITLRLFPYNGYRTVFAVPYGGRTVVSYRTVVIVRWLPYGDYRPVGFVQWSPYDGYNTVVCRSTVVDVPRGVLN